MIFTPGHPQDSPNMAATRSADIPEALITLTAWDKGHMVALGGLEVLENHRFPSFLMGFHGILMGFQ